MARSIGPKRLLSVLATRHCQRARFETPSSADPEDVGKLELEGGSS
jgi:hypothetical protein